ncbi:hypothetical protein DPM19_12135 [Actinomadura craniellae]|uniref:Endonuclease/exonuclease/phosphatase domain-containing protein n=1 Tax=Actinomadura craniellae TaxID=2231787 RepID=A0A365HAZ5_9ACTN|nr:endonuclease/exonuclease/phosphatase family protein [Actinomadura craniellae]RAY15433.1 hypothetical protein DPM19_12135 [Actinomadura craniellae]
MRVASYNIDAAATADQREHQFTRLAELGLDVLGIQEAKHWDRDGWAQLHEAEILLGMRGFPVPSNHHGCHLVLFVREPKVRVLRERHDRAAPYWHALCGLEIVLDEHLFDRIDLYNTHLAPSSPTTRLAEAETFHLLTKRAPVILLGDFNALPAGDPNPPRTDASYRSVRRKLDRTPAAVIAEAGFTDVGAHLEDTTPTVGHAPGSKLAYRCDRICTTLPPAAITGYQVVTDLDDCSDHRPVVAEFTFAKA